MPVASARITASRLCVGKHSATTTRGRSGPSARPRSCLPAMTLVELLTVMAIFAVLAGIFMPVFLQARNMGHQGACITNLRQTTLAMHLYREDYDEFFPSFFADPRSAEHANDLNYWHDTFCRGTFLETNQVAWASLVRTYMGRNSAPLEGEAANVFFCPLDRDRTSRSLTSYEYKMWLAMDRSMPSVEFPGATIQLWEQWTYHSGEMRNEHDRRARMNVSYVDGHIRSLLLSETTSARFGDGPDLHFPFAGSGPDKRYANQDTAQ
jgi:prepilin-type processing-associated H-X9-DG protein